MSKPPILLTGGLDGEMGSNWIGLFPDGVFLTVKSINRATRDTFR